MQRGGVSQVVEVTMTIIKIAENKNRDFLI
jgi:hypothetical protein